MSRLFELLRGTERNQVIPSRASASREYNKASIEHKDEMLSLYRSLDNALPGLENRILMFAGVRGKEGTSTIVSGLARVAAQYFARKVVIVDANTLNPTQHQVFGIRSAHGWEDVIKGTQTTLDVCHASGLIGVSVVPASTASPDLIHMLTGSSADDFFADLRNKFDLVLIDSSPATISQESLQLSSKSDGVILVVEAEATRWPVAENAAQQLVNAGARIIGTVLNKRRFYIPQFLYKKL